MAVYVLVHGAWHGSWCWDKVVSGLEAAGHTAHALDLPGHGGDATPLGEISLDSYVEHVGAILTALPEPAILVGHSLGGLTSPRPGNVTRSTSPSWFIWPPTFPATGRYRRICAIPVRW